MFVDNRPHPLRAKDGNSLRHSVPMGKESTQDDAASVQDEAPEVALTQEEKDEMKEVMRMAQDDTNRVNRWRIMATLVLLITAFCVTYTTYRLLKIEEHNNFETAVR